ncbi:hypothetical protein [Candidatus Mycoplasma haematominutum]|uniref:hypothetical protein n=1 Tax=Candidatus Mycoplasma haematominutum TaxID=209446 RepID=UPI0011B792D1|nr:hypothetical protein [Candidatus Mycoplasma haematominutum]
MLVLYCSFTLSELWNAAARIIEGGVKRGWSLPSKLFSFRGLFHQQRSRKHWVENILAYWTKTLDAAELSYGSLPVNNLSES